MMGCGLCLYLRWLERHHGMNLLDFPGGNRLLSMLPCVKYLGYSFAQESFTL